MLDALVEEHKGMSRWQAAASFASVYGSDPI